MPRRTPSSLRLALKIGAHERHAAIGQPHLRQLHAVSGSPCSSIASSAPVELIGKSPGSNRSGTNACIGARAPLRPPALHEPVHAAHARHRSRGREAPRTGEPSKLPLAPRKAYFGLENRRQRLDPGSQRLNLPFCQTNSVAPERRTLRTVSRAIPSSRAIHARSPCRSENARDRDPPDRLHTRHPPASLPRKAGRIAQDRIRGARVQSEISPLRGLT